MNEEFISKEADEILNELDIIDKSFIALAPELQNFIRYNNKNIGVSMMGLHNTIISLASFYTYSYKRDSEIASLAKKRCIKDGRHYWNYLLGYKTEETKHLSSRINEIHKKLRDVYALLAKLEDPADINIFREKILSIVLSDRTIISFT